MECILNKPYPPIRVEKENIEYAKILLDDYAGSGGEDTAIHEYIYQSLIKEDISSTLKQIARVEMRHLDILGELIVKLGGKPFFSTYKNNTIIPWTSEYVNYTMNIKDLLLVDIKREENTIKRYESDIKIIDDKYIQDILKRIIEDEKLHILCLQSIYNSYE